MLLHELAKKHPYDLILKLKYHGRIIYRSWYCFTKLMKEAGAIMGYRIDKELLFSLLLISIISTTACAQVKVKTHHNFMGSDVYEATDGKVSVKYYNGECCCIAKEVLKRLAEDANSGLLDWDMMQDEIFRKAALRLVCDELKKGDLK